MSAPAPKLAYLNTEFMIKQAMAGRVMSGLQSLKSLRPTMAGAKSLVSRAALPAMTAGVAGSGAGFHFGVNQAMDSVAPGINNTLNDFTQMPFGQRLVAGLGAMFAPDKAADMALAGAKQGLNQNFWSDALGYRRRLIDGVQKLRQPQQ